MDFIYIIGLVYLLVTVSAILSITKKPDLSFWLLINMYFDPGGYLSYVTEPLLGRISITDVLIVFIFYLAFRFKSTIYFLRTDIQLKRFQKSFIIFTLFYFILYGGVIPLLKDDLNYFAFLLKNRYYIYGIILFASIYIFTLRGVKYLYLTTLFIGLTTLILYWVSLSTTIQLIQIVELERYRGSGINRIVMSSYGIFDILFPLATISYFLSRRIALYIPYKKLLFMAGVLMMMTLLITLTRRTIIDIIGSIFIILFLTSKFTRAHVFNISRKIIIPLVVVVIAIFLLKPKYLSYLHQVTTDTALLLLTGEDSRGVSEARVTGEGIYPLVLASIKENALFGNGYTYFYWEHIKSMGSISATSTRGLHYGQLADAAEEIPFVNMFFSFGIAGFLLLLPLYLKIFGIARKLYFFLRSNFFSIIQTSPIETLFSILFVLNMVKLITYNLWNLGDQFIGPRIQINAVWFGLGFSLLHKFMTKKKSLGNNISILKS